MTSNDVMALGRPRTAGARHGLRIVIAALSLSLALLALTAMPVLAAETTSTTTTSSTETGYSQKPKAPEEKEAAPKKEAAEGEPEPAKEKAPAVTPAPTKAATLPFTGFDLRWVLGAGLLLIAIGGVSLRLLRRERRHGIGR